MQNDLPLLQDYITPIRNARHYLWKHPHVMKNRWNFVNNVICDLLDLHVMFQLVGTLRINYFVNLMNIKFCDVILCVIMLVLLFCILHNGISNTSKMIKQREQKRTMTSLVGFQLSTNRYKNYMGFDFFKPQKDT